MFKRMSVQFETQEALKGLGLSDVPLEWINALWDQNFCESVSLPLSVDQSVLLDDGGWRRAVKACRRWMESGRVERGSLVLDQGNEEDEGDAAPGFWTTLLDAGVSHKCLVAILYCLMERSKHRAVDRLCAVHAAQFYLILLKLPGSGAYKMFQPMIFQKLLDTICLFPDKDVGPQRKQSVSSVSEGSAKGGRGKRKRPRPQSTDDSDDNMEEGNDEGEGNVKEGGREDEIRSHLKQLVNDVRSYLKQHSLSDYEAVRYQLVQVILKMARMELSSKTQLEAALSTSSMEAPPMCVFAWQCLDALCETRHGSVEKIASEVFRQLLPGILMLGVDGGVTTSSPLPSPLTTFSQHCLTFVCHIVACHGDSVMTPLKALIQHICTKLPDRAEYRNRLASVVSKLLSLFSDELYSQLLDWIYKLSRNTKVGYRVFSLDIVSELLTRPLRQPKEGSLGGEAEYRLTYKFLLRIVLSRCSDKAPSVRSRALSSLSLAAGSSNPDLVNAVRKSVNSYTTTDPLTALANNQQGAAALPPSENVIIDMVRRRSSDEKVGVRKAALQALEGLIGLDKDHTHKEDVVVLHERCLDPALSVRKQALVSLTSLTLERTHCTMLHTYWLDGVLPMVMDREGGAQEKCLQLLEEVILKNITTLDKSTSEMHQFAWCLLSLISSEDHQDLSRHLCRVLDLWAQQGKLTPALVKAVCSHTHSKDHVQAAWMLLSEMSRFTKSIDTKFLYDNWRQHSSNVTMETNTPLVPIVVAIGNLAPSLSKIAIQDVKDEIVSLLRSFVLSPPVIQAAINTLCQICSALNKTPKDYQSAVDSWCLPLLRVCEEYLSGVMKERDSGVHGEAGGLREKEATTYFFTLGEVAQLCPAHTSHHLCLMVQSILLATSESTDTSSSTSISSSHSQVSTTTTTSSQSSHLSALSDLSLSPSLRAHIYVTLGKLCLQNEELAKKSILHMVKELETSKSPVIRNNIVVILCDLAVRYSTKVDPYISNISASLRDESLLVRKQTLTLLARLLQEDYLKWKGSLFFRFVSSLVDDELKLFGEYCLVHLLLSRHPTVFYQHFIECVFHFNSYEKHKVYNRFKQSDREKRLFSLKGHKNSSKRMTIYTFLLSHMADEHRFQLTAKLCQEVLGGIVDGVIPLDDDSVGVVRDTLAILKCKEIKLSSLRRNVGEELADEGDQVGAAVATAQAKIISQIVKKNVIENIIPIVVSTKHYFEQHHSPLLRDLLFYLKELMQDYRSEVSDILTADRQLAEEIEFDLRRLDEEQKRAAKAVHTPVTVTPHAQMISPLLSPGVLGGSGATATVVATPPKLRTPAGGSAVKMKTPACVPALKNKTPYRIKLGMTPLVVVQKISPEKFNHSTSKLAQTPLAPVNSKTQVPPREEEKIKQEVSSPVAARARASLVNTDYAMGVKTPIMRLGKTVPRVSLQRAVLLSTAKKAGQMKLQTPATEKTIGSSSDATLHLPGRAASTPEGFAESISFNVSSLVPPSPIPPNSTLNCYTSTDESNQTTGVTTRGSKRPSRRQRRKAKQGGDAIPARNLEGRKPGRKKAKKVEIDTADLDGAKQAADIVMVPPNAEPKRLDKWRVKVN